MEFTKLQTWTDGMSIFRDAPHVVFPLLAIVIAAVWWFRGHLLRERIAIVESSLKLANQEAQAAIRAKDEVVKQAHAIQEEVALRNKLSPHLVKLAASLEAALENLSTVNQRVISAVGIASGTSSTSSQRF
jgi:Tfp pilus assembly protein PilX